MTDRSKNQDVADLLREIGHLLEIKGEPIFRTNAYRNAAHYIEEELDEPIERIAAEHRLRDIPGVGEALEQKIGEYLTTGRLQYVERLREQIPPSLLSLLDLSGIGPRKIWLLYERLGVTNLEELEEAARDHRLSGVPGLGEKTELQVLQEIQRLKARPSA